MKKTKIIDKYARKYIDMIKNITILGGDDSDYEDIINTIYDDGFTGGYDNATHNAEREKIRQGKAHSENCPCMDCCAIS